MIKMSDWWSVIEVMIKVRREECSDIWVSLASVDSSAGVVVGCEAWLLLLAGSLCCCCCFSCRRAAAFDFITSTCLSAQKQVFHLAPQT